jgi:hypothetical protein
MADRSKLANALRQELLDGPNAGNEFRFNCDGKPQVSVDLDVPDGPIYTATPLSFKAYTAVHRAMTEAELARLSLERGRPVAARGFHVFDLLRAELGFTRWQENDFLVRFPL